MRVIARLRDIDLVEQLLDYSLPNVGIHGALTSMSAIFDISCRLP